MDLPLHTKSNPDMIAISDDVITKSKCYEAIGDTIYINNMTLSTIRNESITMNPFGDSAINLTDFRKFNSSVWNFENKSVDAVREENVYKESELKTIEIERLEPHGIFVSKYNPLCIIQCDNIKTYFVKNLIFSEYSNPTKIAEDHDLKFILPKNNTFNSSDLVKIIKENNIDIEQEAVEEFITNVNNHFLNPEVKKIENEFGSKRYKSLLTAGISIFLIIVAVVLCIIFKNEMFSNEKKIVLIICIIIFIGLLSLLLYLAIRNLIYTFRVLKDKKSFAIMECMAKNYAHLEDILNAWNRNVFIQHKLFISFPVTMNYMQISFNPFYEYTMKHHEIRD